MSKKEKKSGKHPTQKPLALLERIIAASSNEGDVVLDPFFGTGETSLAESDFGDARTVTFKYTKANEEGVESDMSKNTPGPKMTEGRKTVTSSSPCAAPARA